MSVPVPTPEDLGINTSSVAVVIACLVYVIKALLGYIPKPKVITKEELDAIKKKSEDDLEEMKYKTNIVGILDEMRKDSDETKKRVYHNGKGIDEVKAVSDRTHKYAGEAKEHVKTISQLIANGGMCSYSK